MATVLLDTTLREGELYRPFKQSVRVALVNALLEVGVRRIELTLAYPPRTSPEDLKALVQILNESAAEPVIHCRACKEDVESASRYDCWGIAVYMGLSKIHAKYKFGKDERDELISKMAEIVELSRSLGFRYVRATVEDASRIYMEEGVDELINIVNELRDAGATMVSLPDTAGLMTPALARNFIRDVKERTTARISAHFHNDYGYASANTIESVLAGVDEAHVSVLGIGDRNGIADLYEVVAPLLDVHGVDLGIRRDRLRELYRAFSRMTGIRIPDRHPLSNESMKIRAGVHQFMVVKAPEGYVPAGKLRYDFDSPLFDATPFISKRLVEEVLSGQDIAPEMIKRIAERIGSEAYKEGGRLSVTRIYEILSEYGFQVDRSRLEKFFGSERAYILLKGKNGVTRGRLVEEILRWDEVELIEEVQGGFDLLVLARLNPGIDEFLRKLEDSFGGGIERVEVLTVR